jgi:plastocyanin
MRGRALRHRAGRRGSGLLLGLILVPVVLVGCGGEPTLPAHTATPGPGVGTVATDAEGVQEITLQTQDDYVFTPNTFTVDPGTVRLTVVNAATDMTHNFRFTPDAGPAEIDEEIPLLAPGDEKTIEFTVTDPGNYPFECSFHVQLNQVGTMTVRGS